MNPGMDCLPIQLALVEVVQALLHYTRSEEIQVTPLHFGVEFKSKKRACHHNQKIFYIKVSCNCKFSFKTLIEDGCLPTFTKMILAMQGHEQEAHLSMQQSDATNLNFSTQRILCLSQEKDGKIHVEYRHTSTVTNLDSMECDNFVIHFRVVQPEEYILLEGQQFCKFLYWLKFLNPRIAMSFTMKVSGAVCNTDFSYKKTSSLGNLILISDPLYLLWHSKNRPAGKVLCCRGNSVTMEYEDKSMSVSSSLSISSIICFLPIWKEHPQHSRMTGNCVITVYGPDYIPFQLNSAEVEDFNSLINWGRFSFVIKDKRCLKDCLQWESRMDAEMTDISFLPISSSNTNSFLLHICIVISSKNGCSSKYKCDLHNKISAEKNLLSWPALKKSVESTFQKFCNQNKCAENPKKMSLLTNTIPVISKALCDIVSLSTDTEFRSEIQNITQTECLEKMRSVLSDRLWKISNCQEPSSCISEQSCSQIGQEDVDVPVIDSWRELTSCPDSFHSDGSLEESQRSYTESNQPELMSTSAEQPLASAVPLHQESAIDQLLHDESFFEDFEVDFSNITVGNEFDPLPEALNNNMDFNNEHEETSVITTDNENNTTTNETDSAWFNEVMLDVSDWI